MARRRDANRSHHAHQDRCRCTHPKLRHERDGSGLYLGACRSIIAVKGGVITECSCEKFERKAESEH